VYDSLEQLNAHITLCKKCPSMNSGQKRVTGIGSSKPKIFFLGEAPGRLGADQTGVPFTQDRSGMLLRNMIAGIKLSSRDVYISNVLKCNPRNVKERNRKPTDEELTNCREYLVDELNLVHPKIIVPLGKLASSIFLDENVSMIEINAKVLDHKKYGRIFPLFHPAYVVRGSYSLAKYQQDFRKLNRFLKIQC
jgi:uracil-DNA glycosylase